MRSGLRGELDDTFVVVGEASDAREAITLIESARPDLVVCDLNMPGGGGLAVVRACAASTRIVMLTVSDAERDVLDAVAAGALGYLTKRTTGDELRHSLRRAATGEPVFSPSLAGLVLGEFRQLSKAATGTNPLTEREREVLVLVSRGYPYKQIGAELFISVKTVETHVRNTLKKLHLSRRDELTRYAIDHGLE